MVGLRMSYRRVGLESRDGELPDHIAEVLRFADRQDVEEHDELVQLVLRPALAKMSEILSPTSNPYRHLVAAALHQFSGGRA